MIDMAEENSLFDYSSNQQNGRLPIWKPKETKPAAKSSVFLGTPAPAGCCEFVGGLVDPTIDGRRCIDNTFCPKRIFSDPKIFALCPTRLDKLKYKGQT